MVCLGVIGVLFWIGPSLMGVRPNEGMTLTCHNPYHNNPYHNPNPYHNHNNHNILTIIITTNPIIIIRHPLRCNGCRRLLRSHPLLYHYLLLHRGQLQAPISDQDHLHLPVLDPIHSKTLLDLLLLLHKLILPIVLAVVQGLQAPRENGLDEMRPLFGHAKLVGARAVVQ
jgi:hypothetical protein